MEPIIITHSFGTLLWTSFFFFSFEKFLINGKNENGINIFSHIPSFFWKNIAEFPKYKNRHISTCNKRRVKNWYQPRSKNLERWDFFCLEVNKEKVVTYYHLLFIFHGQIIFCPEVVFIKGCTTSVVLAVVWFLLCVCCLRCLPSPASEKSFFASLLSLPSISVSLSVSSQPCRLWMSCSTCRWKKST